MVVAAGIPRILSLALCVSRHSHRNTERGHVSAVCVRVCVNSESRGVGEGTGCSSHSRESIGCGVGVAWVYKYRAIERNK